MKKMLLIAAFLSAAMFVAAPLSAEEKKPAPAPQKKAPPKPNRGQIINRLKKEHPFRQAKVGENVAFPLLSKAVVRGKVAGITEKGVWIQDGAFKFLQKREVMSLEGRARFYKPDYDKYINSLWGEERRISLWEATEICGLLLESRLPAGFFIPLGNAGTWLKKTVFSCSSG